MFKQLINNIKSIYNLADIITFESYLTLCHDYDFKLIDYIDKYSISICNGYRGTKFELIKLHKIFKLIENNYDIIAIYIAKLYNDDNNNGLVITSKIIKFIKIEQLINFYYININTTNIISISITSSHLATLILSTSLNNIQLNNVYIQQIELTKNIKTIDLRHVTIKNKLKINSKLENLTIVSSSVNKSFTKTLPNSIINLHIEVLNINKLKLPFYIKNIYLSITNVKKIKLPNYVIGVKLFDNDRLQYIMSSKLLCDEVKFNIRSKNCIKYISMNLVNKCVPYYYDFYFSRTLNYTSSYRSVILYLNTI